MTRVALLVAVALMVAACGAGRAVEGAEFLSIPLTDVRTGETFTLGGFSGKVTIAIAMAVW